MIQLSTFKIRCSQIGRIMGGSFGKPTEKQLARIEELIAKKAVKPITAIQEKELEELIAKRDNPPQLQKGAKEYCQEWVKEQLYARKKEFSSKYTEKGNLCEPAAIEMLADRMGYGLISKNQQHFEDAHLTGTPDIILPAIVEDVKNSWNCWTFPLFEPELPEFDYYLQGQGYMALTGKDKFAVNYCLIDAPEELIDREARNVSIKAGFIDVDIELYDEVKTKMTYTNIPDHLKFKRYEFIRNNDVINTIRERVELCRTYITNELTNKF